MSAAKTLYDPDDIDAPAPGRIWAGLFVFLLLLYVALVWAFPYFPSQDGPVHLQIAQSLIDYDNPDYPVMAQYYERQWSIQRNPFTSLVLVSLGTLMPMLVAEKVYLSLIVLLLPLSLLYALRGITRQALYPAFFAFPLTYSFTLMIGFYSFSLGISLFLLTIGLWLRVRERWTVRRVALFAAATFLSYTCHIFAAFNVILFVGLATLWEIAGPFLMKKQWPDFPALKAVVLRRGIPPLIAVSPVLVIVLVFMVDAEPVHPFEIGLVYRLINFIALVPLVSYNGLDRLIAIPVTVLILVRLLDAGKAWYRTRTPLDGTFLFVFAGYFLLMLFLPLSSSGSVYILPRLMNFVFLALVITLAVFPIDRAAWRFTAAVLVVVSLVNLGYRYRQHDLANEYLAEYLSGAGLIVPNSTVLALTVDNETGANAVSQAVLPFLHATGYLVVSRHVVDLTNYQAAHGSYYPVNYRAPLDPYQQLSPYLENIPPLQVKLEYAQGVAGRVDYVLLWGALDSVKDQPEIRELTAQLERNYDLLSVSGERRLMRLYHRKTSAEAVVPAGENG